MTSATLSPTGTPPGTGDFSGKALNGAATFWWFTAILGQWAFFYYILAFYGTSALSGNYETWNRLKVLGAHPYAAGDTAGNLAFLGHALAAGIIAFGGALQLVPWIRARAPAFHRWNGRLFLLTVTGLSLSGFYLVWVRDSGLNPWSTSVNGLLILTFAALALRTAMARDLAGHRRWAMRLYLVSNAQWFVRVGFFAYFILAKGLGFAARGSDPFLKVWPWGCFLVPLLMLEIYLWARDRGGPAARAGAAGLLVALTLLMAVGALGFSLLTLKIIDGSIEGFRL